MGYSTNIKNSMLEVFVANALYISLHSGDPADSGANELDYNGGIYSRQSVTWLPVANGQASMTGTVSFNVPGGGTTVTHVGFWTSGVGGQGTYIGSADVIDETFNNQGVYQVTALTADLNS